MAADRRLTPRGQYDPRLRNGWVAAVYAAQFGLVILAAFLTRPTGWIGAAIFASLALLFLWRLIRELRKP
jgi:hypothetical protein